MSAERHLEYLPLDSVTRATRNPKEHATAEIRASMQALGYTAPVLLDERTQRIVAGHGRLEALAELRAAGREPPEGIQVTDGQWLVPVVRGWASRDDAHAEAALIADNRLTERGGWDDAELGQMLRDIYAAGRDHGQATGYALEDADALLERATARDPAPLGDRAEESFDPPPAPTSTPGDIWVLGDQHRLACGDSRDPALWDVLLTGAPPASCVWTDPPYGVDYVGGTSDELTIAGDTAAAAGPLFAAALAALRPHLRPGAALYVAHPSGVPGEVFTRPLSTPPYSLDQHLVWVKDAFTLGRGDYHFAHEGVAYAHLAGPRAWYGGPERPTVFRVPKPRASRAHPTMKPVELIRPMLVDSTASGDVVLEPFSGSGSTLIAAHAEGRVFRGVELDPGYTDVALARYQAATGRHPVLERTGQAHDFTELARQFGTEAPALD